MLLIKGSWTAVSSRKSPTAHHRPGKHLSFPESGCIRLHPDDMEALFAQIELGTKGGIIYSPLLLTESDGRIFLEVHRDIYNESDVSLRALERLARDALLSDQIDWLRAADVLEQKDGVARDVTLALKAL